jgi:hypothetical protein
MSVPMPICKTIRFNAIGRPPALTA